MGRDHSRHWRRLIAAAVAAVAAAFLVPRVVKAPELDENRVLAARPSLPRDLASLAAFRHEVDDYVADRFPARPHLIGALNFLRLQLGVSGSSRVVAGREGWLFYDNDSHLGAARGAPRLGQAQARQWLSGLAGRTEALRARGAAYLVVVPPDKEAVYPQQAPRWFRLDADRAAVRLANLTAQSQAGEMLYLGPEMARYARAGLKTYSRHDTHWTGIGAYAGYAALMRRLQQMARADGPRPPAAFAEAHHSDLDKPRNLALMLGVASFVRLDYPELDDPEAAAKLTTTYLTDQIDWTKPRVIDTGQAGKPVLLMTMDSFSNALLPFLYGDFSRIVLAHNQDGAWREDLVERFQPDVVILEVVETGLPAVMADGPQASPAAQARIAAALAHPRPTPFAPSPPEADGLPAWRPRVLEPVEGRVARRLDGGSGDDVLDGMGSDDAIFGRGGDDTLHGRGGDDVLRGGKGNDVVDGGDGNDWVSGDRGDDTLSGGRGADLFHSAEGADLDVVIDFSAAEGDHVVLDRGTRYTVRQAGSDTVIEMRGARLILKGVRAASLPRDAILYQ